MNNSMEKPANRDGGVTHLEIGETHAGQRIDNFLHTHLKGVPKSHIYRILRTGQVRVNKGRATPSYRLQAGDAVRLPPIRTAAPPPSSGYQPPSEILEQLSASILYEDKGLLILNKPAGLAVHGGSGISFGVIEGLRALYPRQEFLELVHRLDRETSGCLMIAKKSSVLRHLHDLLRQNQADKQYLALVQGRWPDCLKHVGVPLQKNVLQSGERIVRPSETGKAAQTRFEVRQVFAPATLVLVKPLTGRTHQIRVHAAHAGHPVAGDDKYGTPEFNRAMQGYGLRRLFLHAAYLSVTLPGVEKALEISAPLPPALQNVLRQLERATEVGHAPAI
jgi:23S rRNA pseudouridine955/2504/2580 synthase